MNNFLLMLGALLVGILAALVAVPMAIDWNGYRGVFEEEASRLMGRDVRVGGGVNVRILPVPYVRFEKLRIADTASTGGDPLFRAESVTMRLSIAPLLRGVFEAQSVELKKPQLRLAVDAEGRGNWRSLSLKPGSLPFVPSDVSLQSVGIENGTLVYVGPSGKDLAEFENVAGELSAEGYEGPYKFKGTASWYGEVREIRVATAKPDSDGAIKLRATVRLPSNQNSYTFDGRLLDLKGKPRIDGELTAKLPIAAATGMATKAGEGDANAFELKAKVDGDLSGGTLTDIALSLEQAGDPQLITGTVKATWGNALDFQMALASRSLNLDRFAVDKASSDPLETARTALNVILATLPAEAQTDAQFKAERVTLGGEPLTGVSVSMSRRGGVLELRDLKANLPGQTRLEAAGQISRDAKVPSFAGPISLRGGNLARFLVWARRHDGASGPTSSSAAPVVPRAAPGDAARYEGPFALEGQLAFSGAVIELTRGQAELAGLPLTGDLKINSDGRRKIALSLQGQRIDAAQLWPGGFSAERLRAMILGGPTKSDAQAQGIFGFNPDTTDLKLDVRASEIQITPSTNLKDVDTDLSVDRGKIVVSRLRFATADGLAVDLDGSLAAIPQTAPLPTADGRLRRGTVRWVVSAAQPKAISELISAIDWPTADRPSPATIAALEAFAPIRLAGSTDIGERGTASVDITVDGTIDGGRATGRARFDQGLVLWRSAPLDIAANIDTGNIDRWLTLAGLNPRSNASPARAGQVVFKAVGSPHAGLTALAQATTEGLSVVYQGSANLPADGQIALDGATRIVARDAAEPLALTGLSLGQGPTGLPLSGQVDVTYQAGKSNFTARNMTLAGSPMSGRLSVVTATAKPGEAMARRIDGDITIEAATVQGLLAAVSDRRQETAQPPRGPWPDRPFMFNSLDGVDGKLRLAIGRLGLDGGMALTQAKAVIGLSPAAVTVADFSGNGLGGTWKANVALAKVPGGVGMTSDWTVSNSNLAKLGALASGPISVSATVKGQGLSPSGIISALEGKGTASLAAGHIKGVAAVGVAATIDTVLAGKIEPGGDDLAAAIQKGLAGSTLAYGPRDIAFTISQGIARTEPTVFEAPEGRSTADITVDLNQVRYSTDWRVEAAAKPGVTGKPKAPLPPITVSQTGPLAAIAEAEPKIGLAAFEQEIVVRKLERDVEELERLRKFDEDRRRQEEEAERKRVAAAAAAAALSIPATVEPAEPAPTASDQGTAPVQVPVPVEAVRPKADAASDGASAVAAAPSGSSQASAAQPAASVPASVPQPTPAPRPASRTRPPETWSRPFQNSN